MPPFRLPRRQLQGPVELRRGLHGSPGPQQQLRPRRRQQVVAGQPLDPGQPAQPGLRTVGQADRDRVVQFHHRRAGHRGQLPVQGRDRRPVGLAGGAGVRVLGHDQRLELEHPGPAAGQRGAQHPVRPDDHRQIPGRPVLVVEQNEVAGGVEASGRAGPVEQLQGEQAARLRILRGQRDHQFGEPDGLVHQDGARPGGAAPGEVALVEHQVQHGEHHPDPLARVGGQAKRDARVPDLALGPDDPLGDGRLRLQEGSRDLRGGQAAHQPQGQRDLRVGMERGMAAQQDQSQLLVPDLAVVDHQRRLPAVRVDVRVDGRARHEIRRHGQGSTVRRPGPADPVDRPAGGHGPQPPGRIGRNPRRRPAVQRLDQGVLHGLVGQVEIAEPPGEDGHHPGALAPRQRGDRRIDGPASGRWTVSHRSAGR